MGEEIDTRVVQQAGQARFGDVGVGVVAAGESDDVGWARLSVSSPDRAPVIVELVAGDSTDLPDEVGRLRLENVDPGGIGRRAQVTLGLSPSPGRGR